MTQELVPTPPTLQEEIHADLYERLGVPATASVNDIKRAYRLLAAFFHPDKTTGNRQMFDAVQEAWEVLSDPAKRKQYDEAGIIERDQLDDPIEIEARQQCATILMNIIQHEQDPDHNNILDKLTLIFDNAWKNLRKTEHELLDRERRCRSLRKRLKRDRKKAKKGRSGFLILMLDVQIKQVIEGKEKLERDRKVLARVEEIFAEYTYEVTPRDPWVTSFEEVQTRILRSGPNTPQFFTRG